MLVKVCSVLLCLYRLSCTRGVGKRIAIRICGILTLGKSCKAAKAALAFCSMQAMVADMFKLSGFTSILTVFGSLDEALAGMR